MLQLPAFLLFSTQQVHLLNQQINLISQLMQIQPISHSQPNPENTINNNTQSSTKVVFVQFCTNCDSHLFTIRHDQHKYLHHYEQIKAVLQLNGIAVKKKPVPKQLYKKSPYCPPNVFYKNNGQIVYFPQIGSFEVYLNESKLFSKLQSSKWPNSTHILELIKAKQKQKSQQNQNTQKQEPIGEFESEKRGQQLNKTVEQNSKKQPYGFKKTPLQSNRYSLDKRNLLNSSQSRKNRLKSHRFSHRSSVQKNSEQQKQAEILKMYSPRNKIAFAKQSKNLQIVQLGHKSVRANIYLEPIFPKTKVNLQNYQKHRIILSQKIHRERVTYQARKAQRNKFDSFELIEKKHLNAKFNIDSNALSNIREATQQQQPKIQIITTAVKIEEKAQDMYKQADKKQSNQLALPKENKEDIQWEDYKNTEKIENNGLASQQLKPEILIKAQNTQNLVNKAQQKQQNNGQYKEEFQAQLSKPQNDHEQKKEQKNYQIRTEHQTAKLAQTVQHQKKQQIIASEAKQQAKQQQKYEDAFQPEQPKQQQKNLEAKKQENEAKIEAKQINDEENEKSEKPKDPQYVIKQQNLQ